MIRRFLLGRVVLRLAAGLALLGTAGCGAGAPRACSLEALSGSVAVDVGALDVDFRTVDALLCVEDECAAPDRGYGDGDVLLRYDPEVPRRDEVRVRVVLTHPGTGAELYRGSGAVSVDVLEPNGPGCGETRTLPTVIADRDGTLRS